MESMIGKDVFGLMALNMSYTDIMNMCVASRKFNSQVCDNLYFWRTKVRKDFPDWNRLGNSNPKDAYSILHKLTLLKEKMNIPYDIYNMYTAHYLNLSDKNISEIPEQIGVLQNLRDLNLRNNQIKTIPANILKLNRLISLHLEGNQITELSDILTRMKSLRYLTLDKDIVLDRQKYIRYFGTKTFV